MATLSLALALFSFVSHIKAECGRIGVIGVIDVCLQDDSDGTVTSWAYTCDKDANEFYLTTYDDDSCGNMVNKTLTPFCNAMDCICDTNDECNYATIREVTDVDCDGPGKEEALVMDTCSPAEDSSFELLCIDDQISIISYESSNCDAVNGNSTTEVQDACSPTCYYSIVPSTTKTSSTTDEPDVSGTTTSTQDGTMPEPGVSGTGVMGPSTTKQDSGGSGSGSGHDDNTDGIIIGAVIGAFFAIIVIGMIVWIVIDSKKNKDDAPKSSGKDDYDAVGNVDTDVDTDVETR